MSHKEFVKVQAELDAKGIATLINKVGKKTYNLIVNFEIVKTRNQRRSLKHTVAKMHQKECPESFILSEYWKANEQIKLKSKDKKKQHAA